MLMQCLRAARQTGNSIRFFNIPEQMLAIARASGLDQVLPLHHD
jgi:ABC-type transporter Mla MlaB component